ncbi:MAG TPA: hypothetical protein EYP08_07560 [Pyrodictiaceae archaeon]|nr:hypothetical protein [Pyrodictiaceae archaeon]
MEKTLTRQILFLLGRRYGVSREVLEKLSQLKPLQDIWLAYHSTLVGSWAARLALKEGCNHSKAFVLGVIHDLYEVIGVEELLKTLREIGLGELEQNVRELVGEPLEKLSCETKCVADADILAKAGFSGILSLTASTVYREEDPVTLAVRVLPRTLTILSNPMDTLFTRSARKIAKALLEKTREVFLGLLEELKLHGMPLVPAEAKMRGRQLHYAKLVFCPACSSTQLEVKVVDGGENNTVVRIVQMCRKCGYKMETVMPKPWKLHEHIRKASFAWKKKPQKRV